MSVFTESEVEQAALAWLESLGYTILHGPDIAPGEPFAERDDYGQVALERRLCAEAFDEPCTPDETIPD